MSDSLSNPELIDLDGPPLVRHELTRVGILLALNERPMTGIEVKAWLHAEYGPIAAQSTIYDAIHKLEAVGILDTQASDHGDLYYVADTNRALDTVEMFGEKLARVGDALEIDPTFPEPALEDIFHLDDG